MNTPQNKVGRPMAIKSPAQLWELFADYKTATKKNPIIVIDWVGGAGKRVRRPKERPLTMEGFECYCSDKKVIGSLQNYFANRDGAYSQFEDACYRIKATIRQDQIEGGMVGIYNPSITQRLNNLSDKVENVFVEQPLF